MQEKEKTGKNSPNGIHNLQTNPQRKAHSALDAKQNLESAPAEIESRSSQPSQPGRTDFSDADTGLLKNMAEQAYEDVQSAQDHYIRVDGRKLDAMINLVGELVIASASVNNEVENKNHARLVEATSLLSRIVSEMRDATLKIRMVRIGDILQKFQHKVKDLSQEYGKQVNLVIQGGETELDKTMLNRLQDPLWYIVHNAIEHGIETAQKRKEMNKNPMGQILIKAFHETGSVVIEIHDDGKGLTKDEQRVMFHDQSVTAQQKKVNPDAKTGLAAVKSIIDSLRGNIEVSGNVGQGTKVRIRLPMTLAIIDGFFVAVEDSTWVIPLDMVVECIEFDEKDLISRQRSSSDSADALSQSENEDFINLRGEVLPFLRLGELFGYESAEQSHKNIVVVQYAGQKAGVVVDQLLGEFQTVIKPLGPIFQNLRGVSGATIMGDGEIALIIDVPRLVQYAKETKEIAMKKNVS